jgi:hypothetical protein
VNFLASRFFDAPSALSCVRDTSRTPAVLCTMAGKSISTGTLSLRFMQNAAHRKAKQLGEVETEQAKVKDDGEWEVKKEVREAWGIVSQPT